MLNSFVSLLDDNLIWLEWCISLSKYGIELVGHIQWWLVGCSCQHIVRWDNPLNGDLLTRVINHLLMLVYQRVYQSLFLGCPPVTLKITTTGYIMDIYIYTWYIFIYISYIHRIYIYIYIYIHTYSRIYIYTDLLCPPINYQYECEPLTQLDDPFILLILLLIIAYPLVI